MNKYKQLADHLRTLLTTKTQLKSLVYSPSFKLNVASSYSLLSTCLNNMAEFQRFKDQIGTINKCNVDNPYLFWVMLAEFLNTGRIVGGGKVKRMIVQNAQLLPKSLRKGELKKINKHNIQIRLLNGAKFDELASCIKDSDVPNLIDLTYSEYSQIRSQHPRLFQQPGIVVQSKSSCLPACVLFQGLLGRLHEFDGFDVIDCCAAPGNKTMQLGEYLGSHGTVFAFDKDPKRASLLQTRVTQQRFTNIEVSSEDFLTVSPEDPRYERVKMILADPSCSGSGMLTNFERDSVSSQVTERTSLEDYEASVWDLLCSQQKARITSLQQFQIAILNHCARFKPVRIVYSTCSVYSQENEQVIERFLSENPQYEIKTIRELQNVQRGWGPIGKHCLRVSPLTKQTDGFFVCLLRLRSH